MIVNKIFGIILLILGLLIIFWGLYSSYNIFKGNQILPEVFRSNEIDLGQSKNNTSSTINPQDVQKQMEETVNAQLAKIIPSGSMLKLLNLISWSLFAWILIMGGGKIASIGVKLMVGVD
ncbi:MAG: hypothetical protein NTY11_03280 [Candidatus Parcubacteria bacterium]|nr:hypothetical protein [Candidatus Parcubacteria bacterium]